MSYEQTFLHPLPTDPGMDLSENRVDNHFLVLQLLIISMSIPMFLK